MRVSSAEGDGASSGWIAAGTGNENAPKSKECWLGCMGRAVATEPGATGSEKAVGSNSCSHRLGGVASEVGIGSVKAPSSKKGGGSTAAKDTVSGVGAGKEKALMSNEGGGRGNAKAPMSNEKS